MVRPIPITTSVLVSNGYNTPEFKVQLVLINPASKFARVIFFILPSACSNTYISESTLVVIAVCLDISKSIVLPVIDSASPAVNPEPDEPIKSLYKIFLILLFTSDNKYWSFAAVVVVIGAAVAVLLLAVQIHLA